MELSSIIIFTLSKVTNYQNSTHYLEIYLFITNITLVYFTKHKFFNFIILVKKNTMAGKRILKMKY